MEPYNTQNTNRGAPDLKAGARGLDTRPAPKLPSDKAPGDQSARKTMSLSSLMGSTSSADKQKGMAPRGLPQDARPYAPKNSRATGDREAAAKDGTSRFHGSVKIKGPGPILGKHHREPAAGEPSGPVAKRVATAAPISRDSVPKAGTPLKAALSAQLGKAAKPASSRHESGSAAQLPTPLQRAPSASHGQQHRPQNLEGAASSKAPSQAQPAPQEQRPGAQQRPSPPGGSASQQQQQQEHQAKRLSRQVSAPSRYQNAITDLPPQRRPSDGAKEESPEAAANSVLAGKHANGANGLSAGASGHAAASKPALVKQQSMALDVSKLEVTEGRAVCCFCHRPGEPNTMKGLGDLTCTEEPVLDKKKRLLTHLYYHEPCAAYSGGMGAIPTTIMDVEEDVIKEWQRGSMLNCMHCKGKKGPAKGPSNRATLGCLMPSCRVTLHYPCARELSVDRKVFFAQGPREIVCQKHKQWYLKMKSQGERSNMSESMWLEEEWLGNWMEGSGGWNGAHMDIKDEWERMQPAWPSSVEEAVEVSRIAFEKTKGRLVDSDDPQGEEEPAAAAPAVPAAVRILLPGAKGPRSPRLAKPHRASVPFLPPAQEAMAEPETHPEETFADAPVAETVVLQTPPLTGRESSGTVEIAEVLQSLQEPELPAGKHTGGAAALPGVKGPLLVRSKSKLQLSAAADDQTKPEAVEQRLSSQVVQHRHLPPKKAEAVNAGRRRSADDPKDPDPLPRKSKSEDEEAAGDAMVQKQKSQQLERGPAASKAGSAHKGSARDPKHTQAAHGLEGGDASKAKGSKGGRPSADAPEEPQPGPAELPDEGPGGITEAMESIAIFAVEEWRKLRLAIRSVPVASSQSMLGLSLSHQLAKSLKHSLALWQQSALGDFTYVVGWDATAWAMGMNFLPEERAAIEGSTQRYLKHYAQLRQRGKPLPPDLPITNKVEPCYIGKSDVRLGLHGQEGLQAKSFIPRGTVIGPMKGTLMTAAEFHRWKYTDANIPAGVDRAVWQAVHEGYHLEFRSPDISRAFTWLKDHLVLSMVREGNAAALINDPQISPLVHSNGSSEPEVVALPNVHPLVINFMGFPLVLVVAMVDIEPGQEILFRYGSLYWDRFRESLCSAALNAPPLQPGA